MSGTQVSDPAGAVTVRDPAEIERTPWEPLRGLSGVEHKVLWRSGEMIAGLVRVAAGAEEPGHVHTDADHHVYVLQGSARIAGQPVAAGGFAYVPAGVPHSTDDVGPEGCTFFYTYLPRHR
ncbi:MAG: cupin domain-containing protein [Micromonosporaceae bacterium]